MQKKIKGVYPNVPIIYGGVHPTLLPEETIKHSLVDAICIGEGEKTIVEYLNRLEKGESPNVKGIWYKENGKIVRNSLRPFIQNLDSLPFPNWDYWNIEKYFKTFFIPNSLSILSSRGCPYNCSFCSNRAIASAIPGRYYRIRFAENVIEEIKRDVKNQKRS